MALSISQLQSATSEYNNFKNSLANGQAALKNVISAGTVLFNDANFLAAFPTTWAAYQTYLTSVQSAINTFITNFPVEPPLTS